MEELIIKYLNDTITSEELERLRAGLNDPVHRDVFEKYFRDHYRVLRALTEPDADEGYKKVWEHISLQQSPGERKELSHEIRDSSKQRLGGRVLQITQNRWLAYAAAVALVLILALGYFYRQDGDVPVSPDYSELVPAQDDIILELGDGSREVIRPGEEKDIVDGQGRTIGLQKQNRLDYSREVGVGQSGAPLYNTLIVPYGRRFEVLLSDGTQVHLQAGTSLRFPVRFDGQGSRNVSVEGEAFFEVAEDTEHPFILDAQGLKVEVTGTQFNVAAYPEDASTDVVLVEGGVDLYVKESDRREAVKIIPGEKGSLDRKNNSIGTEKVNTDLYTSWIDGALVFRQMPFDRIMKKLERYYNVEIINTDKKLGRTVFNAHFKKETIADVLRFFSESYDITYEIRDNKVFIE